MSEPSFVEASRLLRVIQTAISHALWMPMNNRIMEAADHEREPNERARG